MENNNQTELPEGISNKYNTLNQTKIKASLDNVPQLATFEKFINIVIYIVNIITGFGVSMILSNSKYNGIDIDFSRVPWYISMSISLLSGYIATRIAQSEYERAKNEISLKMDPAKNKKLEELIQANPNSQMNYAKIAFSSLVVDYFASRFGKFIISFRAMGISLFINIFLQFTVALVIAMFVQA